MRQVFLTIEKGRRLMKKLAIFVFSIIFLGIAPQLSQAGQKKLVLHQNTFVFAGQKKSVDQLKKLISPRCQYMRSIHISTGMDIVDVWGPLLENGKENQERFATPILMQNKLSEGNDKKIIALTSRCVGSPQIDVRFNPDGLSDLSLVNFVPVKSSDNYVVAQIMPLIIKGDRSRWTIDSIVGDNGFDIIHATDTFARRYHITMSGEVSVWTFRDGSLAEVLFQESWDDNEYAHQAMKFSDLILRNRESIGLTFTNHEERQFGWFVFLSK